MCKNISYCYSSIVFLSYYLDAQMSFLRVSPSLRVGVLLIRYKM